jgi:hypothetical protein
MAIYNTAIETTTTALASGSGNRAITTIIICNTTSNAINLTIHAIPSGSSISAATMIVKALSVPAGETVSFDQEKMVLATGDALAAFATNTGLSATVSILAV